MVRLVFRPYTQAFYPEVIQHTSPLFNQNNKLTSFAEIMGLRAKLLFSQNNLNKIQFQLELIKCALFPLRSVYIRCPCAGRKPRHIEYRMKQNVTLDIVKFLQTLHLASARHFKMNVKCSISSLVLTASS